MVNITGTTLSQCVTKAITADRISAHSPADGELSFEAMDSPDASLDLTQYPLDGDFSWYLLSPGGASLTEHLRSLVAERPDTSEVTCIPASNTARLVARMRYAGEVHAYVLPQGVFSVSVWSSLSLFILLLSQFYINQWCTTGPSKAVVCDVLSVGKLI